MEVRLHRSQTVVPGQAAPRLQAHGARWQVELVVHDHDGRRLVDPEARGKGAHGRPGIVHVRGRDRQGNPAPGQGHHRRAGLEALLGPQRSAVALGQQLDRVGPRVMQAPGEFRSGVTQPDNEQVRRRPPVL